MRQYTSRPYWHWSEHKRPRIAHLRVLWITAEEALATLRGLSTFLGAASQSLHLATAATTSGTHDQQNGDVQIAPVETVLSDIRSLLTLLSKETTALSLAFAPPKESWDAVNGVAKKLHDLVGKLLFAMECLAAGHMREQPDKPQRTLLYRAYSHNITDVFVVLQRLAEDAQEIYKSSLSSSSGNSTSLAKGSSASAEQRKLILTRTSQTWNQIEAAQRAPTSERSAFEDAVAGDLSILEDAVDEVNGLLQRQEVASRANGASQRDQPQPADSTRTGEASTSADEDEDEDDFGFGDEDDEEELSQTEIERAQAVFHLMKLTRALVKKVSASAYTSLLAADSADFAKLQKAVQALLEHQDTLALTLYGPQESWDVLEQSKKYTEASGDLASMASRFLEAKSNDHSRSLQDVTDNLRSLSVSGTSDKAAPALSDRAKLQAWFDACQTQINKGAAAVSRLCE